MRFGPYGVVGRQGEGEGDIGQGARDDRVDQSRGAVVRLTRHRPPGGGAARVRGPDRARRVVLRLRHLDGEPVLVERTAYTDWVAPAVRALPDDCVSIMDSIAADAGMVAHYGEHLIDALAAGSEDARLLQVRRGSPLLRQRYLTYTAAGRPIEWTDDRYRAGTVAFSVSNSAAAAPLERHAGPGVAGR
ncbi:UTRA domain-containing protein [Streptomyces niveus]|uniref:UTRA domain-containing protein n=1 Tax=Streptomyces niveus TaxID=193462 RepID=UPI003F4E67FE